MGLATAGLSAPRGAWFSLKTWNTRREATAYGTALRHAHSVTVQWTVPKDAEVSTFLGRPQSRRPVRPLILNITTCLGYQSVNGQYIKCAVSMIDKELSNLCREIYDTIKKDFRTELPPEEADRSLGLSFKLNCRVTSPGKLIYLKGDVPAIGIEGSLL